MTGKLNQLDESTEHDQQEMEIIYRQSYLAWILLLLSWGGFAAYFILPQI